MVVAISAFDHERSLSTVERRLAAARYPISAKGEEGSQFRFCVPLSYYFYNSGLGDGLRSFCPQRN